MRPHRGSSVLVFGILGLVVCPLLGIAAWRMGTDDLREMEFGQMDPSGKDMTNAGRICGMVATGILVFQLVIIFIAVVLALLSSAR